MLELTTDGFFSQPGLGHVRELVSWAPNGSLASSIVGMDYMVRQMKRDTSATLPEVIRMASLTPAELTGIACRTGSIDVGKQADLLLLSRDLRVRQVFIGGSEILFTH